MSATGTTSATASGGVQTVRRLVSYLLLLIMVVIAAIGLSGLLERLLDTGASLVGRDSGGLAQSLAFSLIAGPLAAILWWLTWRGSASVRDRGSVAWPVYLLIASTVSLLVFTIALFSFCAALVRSDWQPSSLAVAIVWGLVWVWHYWMWRHPAKGPTRLAGVTPAVASVIGLVMGVNGLVSAIGGLVDAAVATLGTMVVSGGPFWQSVLQSLVWAVGGGLVWWWHWFRAGVKNQRTGFASVLLVLITGLMALGLFLVGVVMTLYVVLHLVFAAGDPIATILDPLGLAIAASAVGALVLVYHRGIVTRHPDAVQQATRLVTSGVSLAVAATGVGITVNALLAAAGTPLVGFGVRPLLLGGISALLVGGAIWWVSWRPLSASDARRIPTPGRRVYLVVIFGISAIVALVTLLVIGYQLFAFALDGSSGASLLDRVRVALGLLAATVLVAAYHFALWRKDRAADIASERPRTIGQVILVAAADAGPLVSAITEATGARVTVWRRAAADDGDPRVSNPSVSQVLAALDGVAAERILLVTGSGSSVEVIRLEE